MKKLFKLLTFIICLSVIFSIAAFSTVSAFAETSLKAEKPDEVWKTEKVSFVTETDDNGDIVYRDDEGNITSESEGGKPTYLLSSAEQLALLSEILSDSSNSDYSIYIDANFKLTSSLDMGSVNPRKKFTPIEDYNGIFDGAGFSIRYLTISETDETSTDTALFRKNHGTIKNLTIDSNSYIEGVDCVASFAAENYGTIKNCVNKATVVGKTNVAGIVCKNFYTETTVEESTVKSGVISQTYNTGTVKAESSDASGNSFASGGVVYAYGNNSSSYGYISGLANHGKIYATGNYAAGVVCKAGTVEQCFNEGEINAKGYIGGVACESDEILNCFNGGTINAKGENDADSSGFVGGVIAKAKKIGLCYNKGNINVTVNNPDEGQTSLFEFGTVGAIAGYIEAGNSAEKCLYKQDTVTFSPYEGQPNSYGFEAEYDTILSTAVFLRLPNSEGNEIISKSTDLAQELNPILNNQENTTVTQNDSSYVIGGSIVKTDYSDMDLSFNTFAVAVNIKVKDEFVNDFTVSSPEVYIYKNGTEYSLITTDSKRLSVTDIQGEGINEKSLNLILFFDNPGDIIELGIKWNSASVEVKSYCFVVDKNIELFQYESNPDYDPENPDSEEFILNSVNVEAVDFLPSFSDNSRVWSIKGSASSDYTWYENNYIKLNAFTSASYGVTASSENAKPSNVENWFTHTSNLSRFSRTVEAQSDSLDNWGKSESDPYVIKTAAQLANLIDENSEFYKENSSTGFKGLFFRLDNDIDLSGKAFKTIETFKGVFSGNGFTLKNVYIDDEFNGGISSFIKTLGGNETFTVTPSLKNLKISGYIYGTVSAAAFVTESINAEIKNLYNYATVLTSGTTAAGVVLSTDLTKLEYLVNYGIVASVNSLFEPDISIQSEVAGVAISTVSTQFENCYNKGSVYGGIAAGCVILENASGNPTFVNCSNSGSVEAKNAYGVAYASNGINVTLEKCHNTGTVSGVESAFGVAGTQTMSELDFNKCLVSGTVNANSVYRIGNLSQNSSDNIDYSSYTFSLNSENISYGDNISPIDDDIAVIGGYSYKITSAENGTVYKDNKQITVLKTGDFTVNFSVTLSPGTMNEIILSGSVSLNDVNKRALSVKVNDLSSEKYDGLSFTYALTSGSLAANDKLVLSTSKIEGEANKYTIYVSKIINGQGQDVTEMYELTSTNGTLTVTNSDTSETGDEDGSWIYIVTGCLAGVLLILIGVAVYLNIKNKKEGDGTDSDE